MRVRVRVVHCSHLEKLFIPQLRKESPKFVKVSHPTAFSSGCNREMINEKDRRTE